jgi:hypothetical protein
MRTLKYLLNTGYGKAVFVLVAVSLLASWWAHGHIWFRIDDHNVSINGRSLAEGSDYSCFKSMNGDIFCYHQDHGTLYFISPKKGEVSTIDETVDLGYWEFVLLSGGARDGFENSGLKHRLRETSLIIGNGFVEFEPSVTEFKGPQVERWHIAY